MKRQLYPSDSSNFPSWHWRNPRCLTVMQAFWPFRNQWSAESTKPRDQVFCRFFEHIYTKKTCFCLVLFSINLFWLFVYNNVVLIMFIYLWKKKVNKSKQIFSYSAILCVNDKPYGPFIAESTNMYQRQVCLVSFFWRWLVVHVD